MFSLSTFSLLRSIAPSLMWHSGVIRSLISTAAGSNPSCVASNPTCDETLTLQTEISARSSNLPLHLMIGLGIVIKSSVTRLGEISPFGLQFSPIFYAFVHGNVLGYFLVKFGLLFY